MASTETAAAPRAAAQRSGGDNSPLSAFLSIFGRFVSCGILSLGGSIIWRLCTAPAGAGLLGPAKLGIGAALLGVISLLAGFLVGGLAWYVRDARLRSRAPERISDERIIFSFIVFVVMPVVVMSLLGLVALLAWFIGG